MFSSRTTSMPKNQSKTSSDVYGGQLNVKYVSLGSVFRQFVLSRSNVNYFHYVWTMCVVFAAVFFVAVLLQKFNERIPRIGIIIFAVFFILASIVYCIITEIVEETVEVIDGFGIQLSARGRFGKENKTFFDFSMIKDIIINEAVTLQRVVFYLALQISSDHKTNTKDQDQTGLIVLFKHTMPRLEILQDVYNEIEPFLNNHNNKDE